MTITSSDLHIDVQESERWRRTLSVTVPAGVVKDERARTVKRLAGKLNLPGFRKGKVPPAVVEKQYGPALQKETLDRVIDQAYRTALADRALQPISQGEVEDIDYKPEADLTFRISFDVRPTVELGVLGGFVVERPRHEVGEEEIDQVIDRLRDQSAMWKPVEDGDRPEEGNLVSVRIVRLQDDGEPDGEPQGYQLVLGDGDAIPDVEAAILSLAPGESGDFTVRFPMDFHNEARRGEEQRLRISLEDRRVKELPALDDEFARTVGEFEDLAALRARVRQDLEEEAANQIEGAVRARLLDRVIEANPFEVPRSMVERYVESLLGDISQADPQAVATARAQIGPEAELSVKRLLALDRIAETQGLTATRDEVEARIAELAERNQITPAQARAQLQKAKRLDGMERDITETKVFDFLKSQSEIRDES